MKDEDLALLVRLGRLSESHSGLEMDEDDELLEDELMGWYDLAVDEYEALLQKHHQTPRGRAWLELRNAWVGLAERVSEVSPEVRAELFAGLSSKLRGDIPFVVRELAPLIRSKADQEPAERLLVLTLMERGEASPQFMMQVVDQLMGLAEEAEIDIQALFERVAGLSVSEADTLQFNAYKEMSFDSWA